MARRRDKSDDGIVLFARANPVIPDDHIARKATILVSGIPSHQESSGVKEAGSAVKLTAQLFHDHRSTKEARVGPHTSQHVQR